MNSLQTVLANNCKNKQIELLTENSINLLSIGIRYLSIRSLILTKDVSIIKVTANGYHYDKKFPIAN